jgi:hypothetical protein
MRNEELHNLYYLPDTRVIKLRSMRLAGHVAPIEERRNVHRILVKKVEGIIWMT